ncbi:MAG: hypothetical protein A2Y45_02530 [Tenericutes bacterium GWC2_34_14]|nr:MAG: hypothetical protein A2Y45_02530 [Tenericutes bacterium GWC2_34_14]OHE32948.1 MAG: hypothetical protein A2012_09700 [Tenericutes bacterium GWE2_34_108]OHE47000.1 MAG: hypothetical protein A3K26_02230 [Tenericutes bacterium RIFOXYA12_FULL_35_10]HBO66714.1 hypothetical protein [Acholeplasmataceae bacterium]
MICKSIIISNLFQRFKKWFFHSLKKAKFMVDKCGVFLYNEKAWFRKKGGFICEKNISTK